MGAYGSPELPPSRPPYPRREPVSEHRQWNAWTGPDHRSTPVRVILWSLAIIVASFAALVVAAVVVGIVQGIHAAH